jgi:DNA-binding helix-hairpin-helix protein with protein kinase domain
MNQYECPKCGRNVVQNNKSDTANVKCCNGDNLLTFKKVGTKIIIPVAKLVTPDSLKPLPKSTPDEPVKQTAAALQTK